VFALYNQSRRAKYFLLSIFGISTVLEVVGNFATGKMYSTRAECTMLVSAPPDSGLAWFAYVFPSVICLLVDLLLLT